MLIVYGIPYIYIGSKSLLISTTSIAIAIITVLGGQDASICAAGRTSSVLFVYPQHGSAASVGSSTSMMGRSVEDLSHDLEVVKRVGSSVGLVLNAGKTEILVSCPETADTIASSLPGAKLVCTSQATLLGRAGCRVSSGYSGWSMKFVSKRTTWSRGSGSGTLCELSVVCVQVWYTGNAYTFHKVMFPFFFLVPQADFFLKGVDTEGSAVLMLSSLALYCVGCAIIYRVC